MLAKPPVTRAKRVKSSSPGRPVHRPASGRAPSSPAGSMNRSDLGPLVRVSGPPATLAWHAGDPEDSKGNGTPGRRKSVTVAVSHGQPCSGWNPCPQVARDANRVEGWILDSGRQWRG